MATVKKSVKLSNARAKNPLKRGYSKATVSANIAELIRAGFKKAQAVAMAMESARNDWERRKGNAPYPRHLVYATNPRAKKPAAPKRVPQIKNERFMNRLQAAIQASVLEAKHKNNSIKMQATVSYAQGVIDAGFDTGVLSAEKAGDYLHKVVTAFRAWDKKRAG